jgi:hypothetical protein
VPFIDALAGASQVKGEIGVHRRVDREQGNGNGADRVVPPSSSDGEPGVDVDRRGRRCRSRRSVVTGVLVLVALVFAVGFIVGAWARSTASVAPERRDFLFQVLGVHTPNQGGQTVNLLVYYRYNTGIAERDLPNYLHLRAAAIGYLTTGEFSGNPYWETVNQNLCAELKNKFPVQAISCELQIAGVDAPGPRYEPGYHASIETLGDIAPLVVTPGP